jgi:hypothetical protein
MRGRSALLLVVATALHACATQSGMEISRFDGETLDSAVRERATKECTAQAELTRASVTTYYAGVELGELGRWAEQEHVQQAAFKGCMAERGLKVVQIK